MPSQVEPEPRSPFNERSVVRALAFGFGLVMLLLGAAGVLAVREGRSIRESASKLVREQILVTKLLHEAQVEEDALALALHRLAGTVGAGERAEALAGLEKADLAIARLADEAALSPEAESWRRLSQEARAFTLEARSALGDGQGTAPASLEDLFSRHDEVVRLIHELILESTGHLEEIDRRLALQLGDLARESAFLLGACFLLALLCAVGTILYVRWMVHRMKAQAEELHQVSWHMLQTQEEAARRFSHELHDELGQSLAAVKANIGRGDGDDAAEAKEDSLRLVDEAIANVRELSQLLRPVILDDFGLDAGLSWLAARFGERTRTDVRYESSLVGRLRSDVETHLFRIAQEALTNIARHSEATEVRISLIGIDSFVVLRLEDNGRGLPPVPSAGRRSLGLTGMRARARACGGNLRFESPTGGGLVVLVQVPALLADGEDREGGDGDVSAGAGALQ